MNLSKRKEQQEEEDLKKSIIVDLTIIEAKNIGITEIKNSDCQVSLRTKRQSFQTQIIKKMINPIFNETFNCTFKIGDYIDFEVRDPKDKKKTKYGGIYKYRVHPMIVGQERYEILECEKRGYLYIKMKCTKSPIDDKRLDFDFEKPMTLLINVKRVYGFWNGLMTKGNVNLKKTKLSSLQYSLELYSNTTKPVRLQCRKSAENEMEGNSVTFNEETIVQCPVNDELKFSFMITEKKEKDLREILNAVFVVPDLFENEKLTLLYPFNDSGTIEMEITCLNSVYSFIYDDDIPPETIKEPTGQILMKVRSIVGFGDYHSPYCHIQFPKFTVLTSPIEHNGKNMIYNEVFMINAKEGETITVAMFNRNVKNPTEDGHRLIEASIPMPEVKSELKKVFVSFTTNSQLKLEFTRLRKTSRQFGDLEETNRVEKLDFQMERVFNDFDKEKKGILSVFDFRAAIQYFVPTMTRNIGVFLFALFSENYGISIDKFKKACELTSQYKKNIFDLIQYMWNEYADPKQTGVLSFHDFENKFIKRTQISEEASDVKKAFFEFSNGNDDLNFSQFERFVRCFNIE